MNAFDRLYDEAKKKKKQLEAVINPAAVPMERNAQAKIRNAKYGVLANNPAAQQNFIRGQQVQPFSPIKQGLRDAGMATALGTMRGAVDIGQAASGAYDLISRGTGTNRVSKRLDSYAKALDSTAKNEGLNANYNVMQAPVQVGAFMAPGVGWQLAGAKVAAKAPKAAAVFNPVTKAVAKKAGQLEQRGAKGRILATGLKSGTSAPLVVDAGVGIGYDLGLQSGKGQDISPLDVGISAAANYGAVTALPMVGQGLVEGAKAAKPAAKAAAAKTKQVRASGQHKLQDIQADKRILKRLSQERAAVLRQIERTPVGNTIANNNLQARLDRIDHRTQAIKANKQHLTIPEKVMTANPGLTVGGPNALRYYEAKKHGLVFDGPAMSIDPDDAKIQAALKGQGSNRTDNLRQIEQQQDNLTDADRLRLANGDTGQAGLQMEQSARDAMLAKFRAQAAAGAKASALTDQSGAIPLAPLADAMDGVKSLLRRAKEANQRLGEGGYARIPGSTPAESPQPTPPAAPAAPTPKPKRTGSSTGSIAPKQTAALTPEQTDEYLKSLSKAQQDAQKGGSGIGNITADFKEKFIDDLAPIEDRLNKAIKSGAAIDPKDHITYQLDRSRRAEGIMNAYVRDNKLDKLIQNVDNTDEFDQYLIARHAKELDPEIRTGRDAAKDAALVRQLNGKYEKAAKELYAYNQKLLKTAADYGLISRQTAAALKKKYPEYVPFNRIFNEDEMANLAGGVGRGDASLSSQSVVKGIKGSERAIASPLNSIIDKTRVVIEQGERNKAAQMLASYKKLPGNPFNLKELAPNENIAGRPTISFLDRGKKRTFLTDKVIADAAKNMSRQDIGLWGRIAAIPARALRSGATAANIGFAGANIIKDMVGAAINSKHPVRIADPENFGKALQSAFYHEGEAFRELMREGVAGTSFDMFRNPLKSNVAELRSYKNPLTRAGYVATHPGQWYRSIENTIGRSEDFGRALQYYSNKKGYLADGKTADDATLLAGDQARHNSTNFFRHGSVGKGVNLAVPYWNAGVQGARIMTRRIKERPAATLTKMGVAIVAPSAMIALNNYSDEEKRAVMDSIPDYEKEFNIIIVGSNPRYNKEKNDWEGVYKFPVPPQHIGLHNTVQDAVKSAKTGQGFNTARNVGLVAENYTTFNVTSPREIANRYTPQAVKLIAEPTTNTNLFTGNKIVPDSQRNLPAKDQVSDYSSGTARTLGNLLNVSPRQIDNSIRTGLGGAGQNLVHGVDSALAKAGVISPEEVRGKSLAESVTGRFHRPNAISPKDKAEKQFAELKKQITDSDEYKNASAYDKGRMLNRLESDLNAVAYHQDGDTDKKLTKKQQSIITEGFKKENYTNLDDKRGGSSTEVQGSIDAHSKKVLNEYNSLTDEERRAKAYNEPSYDWKVAKSKLENDKAAGKLSRTQIVNREQAVKKADVGKKFSKDIREMYGSLSKSEIYDLVSTDPDGNKIVEQLLAYGDALVDADIEDHKLRDKYGNVAIKPKTSGRRGGRAATLSPSDFKLPINSLIQSTTKGAALARSAKLARRRR